MVKVAVIGGGVVGLATAYQILQQRPDVQVQLLEKEASLASHQSGRNSGVLHSGIYYKPGSLKAINCRQGKKAMEAFCIEHDIPFETCGKVIVAIDESEIPELERIYQRGKQNDVECRLIQRSELLELEPHVNGVKAIHVPEAGIVDYAKVCEKLGALIELSGSRFHLNTPVKSIETMGKETVVTTADDELVVDLVINCAGLHCDRIARKAGQRPAKIIPFRGEYFELNESARHLCRNMIYPVPNTRFPFLGVHFTRMISGAVECGPNAVFALAREGYSKWSINLRDLFESVTYRGFVRMSLKHWRMGLGECYRSISKAAFVRALQRLVPEINSEYLSAAPSGIRAQAVLPNGKPVDDFMIIESEKVISINNAPSPAATASLNIGRMISEKVLDRIGAH